MSQGMNRVTLLGHLGADPELRVTPGGQAVLKLRMATTESYLDANKVRQERTEWHRCTVFGKRAEGLGKFLTKGMQVCVEGRIQTSKYQKNGEDRYSTDIVVNELYVCGGRSERSAETPAPTRQYAASPSAPQYDASVDESDIPF